MTTRALSLDMDDLPNLRLAVHFTLGFQSFWVLVKISGNKFILHDPDLWPPGGRYWREMSRNFTSVALETWPRQHLPGQEVVKNSATA